MRKIVVLTMITFVVVLLFLASSAFSSLSNSVLITNTGKVSINQTVPAGILFAEGFENGTPGWIPNPYGGLSPTTTDEWAYEGSYSLGVKSNWAISKDVPNENSAAPVYVWAYVRFAGFNWTHVGSGCGQGVFELRNTYANVIGFVEILSLDEGQTFYWNLVSFNMTMPHSLGPRSVSVAQVYPNVTYKVVMHYVHTEENQWLSLWIDDVLACEVATDFAFNYVANNIYAGSPKAEWTYLTDYMYLDWIGLGYEYPA